MCSTLARLESNSALTTVHSNHEVTHSHGGDSRSRRSWGSSFTTSLQQVVYIQVFPSSGILERKTCLQVGFWKKWHIQIRRRETNVMSQTMSDLRKEAKKSCDWQTKNEVSIVENDCFGKWLEEHNLGLRPILWEICSNTYSNWKERNMHYKDGPKIPFLAPY